MPEVYEDDLMSGSMDGCCPFCERPGFGTAFSCDYCGEDMVLDQKSPNGWAITHPNPGSKPARDRGCTCAVLDNSHGLGYLGCPGVWAKMSNCPLHGDV